MTGPLSRTAVIAVIAVVAASLVSAAVLTVVSGDVEARRSAGVDAYSVSAIGHQGWCGCSRSSTCRSWSAAATRWSARRAGS